MRSTLLIVIVAALFAVAASQDVQPSPLVPASAATDCHPTCRWSCDDPICPAQCHPVCERPKCQVHCEETPCAQCKVQCDKPHCNVRSPKALCEKADCPACDTVCAPAVCRTSCVAPNAVCTPMCEETKCDWKCKKPTLCPRPKCELVCEQSSCPSTPRTQNITLGCCACHAFNLQAALVQAGEVTHPTGVAPSFLELTHEIKFQQQNGQTPCCPCAN